MTLPFSRNTNYTAGAPVKAVDLNDIQDAIVAAYRSEGWLPLPLVGRFDNCAYNEPAGYVECTGAPWSATLPIVVPPGTRIKGARILRFGAATSSMNLRLRRIDATSGAPTMGTVKTVTIASPPASWTASELALATSEWFTTTRTLVAYLFVDGAGAAGTQRFSFPEVFVDRP